MFLSVLLVLSVLGSVRAQTFSEGPCNPDIETQKDFDITKFNGTWYAVKRGYNFYEDRTKCYVVTFSLEENQDRSLNLEGAYEIENVGPQTMKFKISGTEEELKAGRFTATPGFISSFMPYWVLDTDYDHYTTMYSCTNAYQGKIEFTWINTRTQIPDKTVVAKAVEIARSRNINIPFIDANTNCS